ncbi:MAG: endonuclease [Bacteroidia bacterium]|nr:endonuclease [Bacteroidia bacterium]
MAASRLKYYLLLIIILQVSLILSGQPAGYYDSAAGLTGTALQQALHDIIDNHTSVSYADLWTDFQTTDKKSDGNVWDMYSDIPSGTPAYTFIFITNQCGNYNSEADCYNREHSFPKSWFGGDVEPMYTDLFHLYPTDGYVNGKRDNFPFGITSSPAWTSTNGSKLGPNSYSGYTGTVFEPINAYKGDFARSFFYMAVRYFGEDASWPGSEMVTGSQPKSWALKMLLEWDLSDPVSQKETDRNNAVYLIQGNRNPFIDNTSYASQIWGSQVDVKDITQEQSMIRIWPNPAGETATIELSGQLNDTYNIKIINVSGKTIMNRSVSGNPVSLDVTTFKTGYYIVIVSGNTGVLSVPLVISH